MREIGRLQVRYQGRIVGTIAKTRDGKGAFQYDRSWREDGFSLNPLSLPLNDQVFVPRSHVLDGLFGVFADSLPDGWGRLLVDRMLLARKISPGSAGAMERLGIVGSSGMGALEYVPELFHMNQTEQTDFDRLSHECEKILREQDCENLDLLFQLGGSSGGARPKALVTVDDGAWIVKFPSSYDRKTIGEEEYRYMKCAETCGIQVPEIRLFPSAEGPGFFGAKRFDRKCGRKIHMVTVSGLLETSHRIPNLDYHDLMKLTYILTKDIGQIEEMYRRMCFNVFAHNRDDHSKNFSFLYNEEGETWQLTPAYDLTFSCSIGGEHATCVDGNGKNPGMKELEAVGTQAGISKARATALGKEIREIVETDLKDILR